MEKNLRGKKAEKFADVLSKMESIRDDLKKLGYKGPNPNVVDALFDFCTDFETDFGEDGKYNDPIKLLDLLEHVIGRMYEELEEGA